MTSYLRAVTNSVKTIKAPFRSKSNGKDNIYYATLTTDKNQVKFSVMPS